MVNITFKNVGQGDSILLHWVIDSIDHYGIIDCNLHEGRNPILEDIIARQIAYLDFVILSHLHADHFSGMGELLEFCKLHNIRIGCFYHSFENQYLKLLSEILLSQRNISLAVKFMSIFKIMIDSGSIVETERFSHKTKDIKLTEKEILAFISPIGNDYFDFTHSQSRYIAKETSTLPDFNNLSSIIKITNDNNEALLLTADAPKKAFFRLTGNLKEKVVGIQVPHHGSLNNHVPKFWQTLQKETQCKSIFSVGYVLRDKLPKREVVEFFENEGYYNESTNFVNGIQEYYGAPINNTSRARSISLSLSSFSKLVSSTGIGAPDGSLRFTGDRLLTI